MNLKLLADETSLTAQITGDIDHHTAIVLREKVDKQILELIPKNLILDFEGVDFMDSSGLGFIMGRYKLMTKNGGATVVIGAKGRIKTILDLSGAAKFVKIM